MRQGKGIKLWVIARGWLDKSVFPSALQCRYDGWPRVSYVNLSVGLPLRWDLLMSSFSPMFPSSISSTSSGIFSTNSGLSWTSSLSWVLPASCLTGGQNSLAVARNLGWFWGFCCGMIYVRVAEALQVYSMRFCSGGHYGRYTLLLPQSYLLLVCWCLFQVVSVFSVLSFLPQGVLIQEVGHLLAAAGFCEAHAVTCYLSLAVLYRLVHLPIFPPRNVLLHSLSGPPLSERFFTSTLSPGWRVTPLTPLSYCFFPLAEDFWLLSAAIW